MRIREWLWFDGKGKTRNAIEAGSPRLRGGPAARSWRFAGGVEDEQSWI